MQVYSQVVRPAKALTFVLSWGAIALLIVFYDQIVALFGERSKTNPVFIIVGIPAIVYAAAAAKGSMSIALPVIRFC